MYVQSALLLVLLFSACWQVDETRDEAFIDDIMDILTASDITEVKHLKNVDKVPCEGSSQGKKA